MFTVSIQLRAGLLHDVRPFHRLFFDERGECLGRAADRLGLDGGSARTGIVTAAEIQNGRYRILKAGTPFENPEPSGE